VRWLAVILPGPLAAAVALATADGVHLPWLLLGTRLEADATGRVVLLLAAVVWTAAGLALGPTSRDDGVRAGRLAAFGGVALAGNLGVAVAQDVVSFYTCFSVMSLATYGLVAARSGEPGRRAGRLYIAMAVAAEAVLLAGLVLAVRSAGGSDLVDVRGALAVAPERDLVIALLLVGFGVKAGMLGVHAWLPRAYAAAPLPVAAVLAGALTELGVLGWLRVMPIGEAALPAWGAGLVVLGVAAVGYGGAVGVTRTTTSGALAYSSIGQIGLMTAGLGVALARPDLAPAATVAVLLLMLHHGIVKGGLFLAVGVVAAARAGRPRRVALAVLVLLALSLAGAPLTSGAAAKDALSSPGSAYWGGMSVVLSSSAVVSALLMWRVIHLVGVRGGTVERLPGRLPAAGVGLAAVAAVAIPVVARRWPPLADAASAAPSIAAAAAALWPLGVAALVVVIAARAVPGTLAARRTPRGRLPATALVAATRRTRTARGAAVDLALRVRARLAAIDAPALGRVADAAEARAGGLGAGAAALAALVLALVVVLR